MAENKIDIGKEFFSSFGTEELAALITNIKTLQATYGTLITETVKGLKEVKAANQDLAKETDGYEKALRGLNITLEADQEKLKTIVPLMDKMADAGQHLVKQEEELKRSLAESAKAAKDLAESKKKVIAEAKKAGAAIELEAGSIAELRQQTANAKKALDAMGDSVDPFLKSKALDNWVKYKNQLEAAEKANKDVAKEAKLNAAVLDNAAGAVDQLKAKLALATTQYNAMSGAERKNTEAGKALGKEVRELNEELKEAGATAGDFRRFVGGYTEGILKAVDGTGLLATVTQTAEQAQKGYAATLTITKAGLAGNITMLKAFKLALAATGIGAVVLLLGGLISFLTRTQEGIDFVSAKTKGFTTVLGVLIDKLSAVGKDLFEAFDNPKKALNDLVSFLETNLLNRVKAFAVIWEGLRNRDFTKLNDGIIQLGLGITDASGKTKRFAKELNDVAKAGAAIERENQRIRDAEIQLNKERANTRAMIKELNFIAEDSTRGVKEREAAARKALAIEQSLFNKQIQLQNERIANLKKEQSLTNNLTADNQKLAEEEQRLAEIRTDSFDLQTEINNKLNTIRNEGLALDRKAAADRLRDREAGLKKELLTVEANGQKELTIKKKLIDVAADIEIAGADKTKNEIAVIRGQALLDKKKLDEDYFKFQIEQNDKALKEAEEARKKAIEIQYGALDGLASKQQVANDQLNAAAIQALNEQLATKKINYDKYLEEIEKVEGASTRQSLLNEIAAIQNKLGISSLSYDERVKLEQEYNDKIKALRAADTANFQNEEVKKLEKRKEVLHATQDLAMQAYAGAFEVMKIQSDNQLETLTKQKDAEMAKISEAEQHSLAVSSQSAEVQEKLKSDYQAIRERKEAEFAKRQAAIKTRQAKQERAKALFDIAIETAVATIKAVRATPETFGLPFSAYAIIQGAIAAGIVLSKPLPQFFRGVKGFRGGPAIVGERGTELIEENGKVRLSANKPQLTMLERGANVYTADQTKNILHNFQKQETMLAAEQLKNSFTSSVAGISKAEQSRLMYQLHLQNNAGSGALIDKMDQLKKAYLNRPQYNTTLTEKGFQKEVQRGANITRYLNSYFPNGKL